MRWWLFVDMGTGACGPQLKSGCRCRVTGLAIDVDWRYVVPPARTPGGGGVNDGFFGGGGRRMVSNACGGGRGGGVGL
jgi:hypothetical protein